MESLALLDDARRHMVAAMAPLRLSDDQAALAMQEAFAAVLPHLPGMIDERVGFADARILTNEELRMLLARFALEMLAIQTGVYSTHRSRLAESDR